ncbi:MAG TPA: hypothetical protein VI521_00430 [Candidatus Babeliales bacterium]|nr:hypothetical protein [Candidatus Babeliales bacterium]
MKKIKKALLLSLIINSATVFSMRLELQNPIAGLSRHETFIASEYLKACLQGDTKKAVVLLKSAKGKLLALTTFTDKKGLTGLMLAAGNGHTQTVGKLLPLHTPDEKEIKDPVKNFTAKEWAKYYDCEQCALAFENPLE